MVINLSTTEDAADTEEQDLARHGFDLRVPRVLCGGVLS
jgi:hypothetical protein